MSAGRTAEPDLLLHNGELNFSARTAGLETNLNGELVICLHGFPDNNRSFRHQLPAFAGAGYRVVAPNLRGYEPSSQPSDDDYSLATLGRDVIAWIDDLGEDRVHLVGHDWGAAIAYIAGALAPERFHSLATIAVPHAARLPSGIRKVPVQLAKSWYMTFFQTPRVAEAVLERNDWALVRRLWRSWAPGYTLPESEWLHLKTTFEAPGVTRAMLSYYRQNATPLVLLGLKQTEASRLTMVPVRTLAITGADDGCIDTRIYDHVFDYEDFPMGVHVERIEAAGHFAHQEQPDEVNELLIDWFAH